MTDKNTAESERSVAKVIVRRIRSLTCYAKHHFVSPTDWSDQSLRRDRRGVPARLRAMGMARAGATVKSMGLVSASAKPTQLDPVI